MTAANFNFAETYGRGDNIGTDHEAEPSLAHTNDLDQSRAHLLIRNWDSASDLETEHDGREPQCEDEGAQCEDEGAEPTEGVHAVI